MAKGVLEYDLDKPNEKAIFDSAPDGWRYRKFAESLLKRLSKEPVHPPFATLVVEAARDAGLPDVTSKALAISKAKAN